MKKYTNVFVKNDINSTPLFVGDKVRVTRAAMEFMHNEEWITIDEQSWEGEIVLLLSRGICIRVGSGYIKPNLGNGEYVKWTWEKL